MKVLIQYNTHQVCEPIIIHENVTDVSRQLGDNILQISCSNCDDIYIPLFNVLWYKIVKDGESK